MLRVFERRILRMIHSPVNYNGILGTGYNNELYTHYDELDLAWSKYEDCGVWDTSVECKNWILAESLLFLQQNTLHV